jgi:hypothetical protein
MADDHLPEVIAGMEFQIEYLNLEKHPSWGGEEFFPFFRTKVLTLTPLPLKVGMSLTRRNEPRGSHVGEVFQDFTQRVSFA